MGTKSNKENKIVYKFQVLYIDVLMHRWQMNIRIKYTNRQEVYEIICPKDTKYSISRHTRKEAIKTRLLR